MVLRTMIRPRWTLLPACLAGVLLPFVLVTGAAAATTAKLVLDPIHGPGGTTVALVGTGFCVSCGVVEIDFDAQPVKRGIAVAADGSFQTTFMVPGGAQAGTNAINAYAEPPGYAHCDSDSSALPGSTALPGLVGRRRVAVPNCGREPWRFPRWPFHRDRRRPGCRRRRDHCRLVAAPPDVNRLVRAPSNWSIL